MAVQLLLNSLAGQARVRQVQQEQVVVRSPGDHLIAHLEERIAHGLAVADHRVDVALEILGAGLLGGDGLPGHHVLQCAALDSGKNGAVHLLGKLRPAEDQAAPCAPQGLVGGGGNDVRQAEGGGMVPGRHQPGNVGHIHHEICTDFLCSSCKGPKVNDAAISGCAGQNQLRPVRGCFSSHVVVVDEAPVVHTVEHHVVQLAAEIHRGTVGQVAAVVQAHGQDGIPRLQHAHIGGKVGGGAAMGLDIDVIIRPEYLLPHAAAVFLQLVHAAAATVVPAPVAGAMPGGIAL